MVKLNYEEDRTPEVWREWEMHVLMLQEQPRQQQSDKCEETSGDFSRYGMVVRRIEVDQESQFQRVGWMFLNKIEGAALRDDGQSWSTIKLV